MVDGTRGSFFLLRMSRERFGGANDLRHERVAAAGDACDKRTPERPSPSALRTAAM